MGFVVECHKCGGKKYPWSYRNGKIIGGVPPGSTTHCKCKIEGLEEFLKNNK